MLANVPPARGSDLVGIWVRQGTDGSPQRQRQLRSRFQPAALPADVAWSLGRGQSRPGNNRLSGTHLRQDAPGRRINRGTGLRRTRLSRIKPLTEHSHKRCLLLTRKINVADLVGPLSLEPQVSLTRKQEGRPSSWSIATRLSFGVSGSFLCHHHYCARCYRHQAFQHCRCSHSHHAMLNPWEKYPRSQRRGRGCLAQLRHMFAACRTTGSSGAPRRARKRELCGKRMGWYRKHQRDE